MIRTSRMELQADLMVHGLEKLDSPAASDIIRSRYGPLAQLAEQLTLNQWVLGSSPSGVT